MPKRLVSACVRLATRLAIPAATLLAVPLVVSPAASAAEKVGRKRGHVVGVAANIEEGKDLRGSTVRLYSVTKTRRGRTVTRLLARPKRSRNGAAVFRLDRVPGTLRAVVTGGRADGKPFRGTMLAQVRGHRSGDFILVSPATTVLARYQIRRPKLRTGTAHAHVRRYLGVPAGYTLAHDSHFAEPADLRFSGVKLIRTARANGGFDRYVKRLSGRVRAKTPPVKQFTPAPARRTTTTRAPRATASRSAPTPSWLPPGPEEMAFGFVSGILDKAAGGITDAAISWIGQYVPFLAFLDGDSPFDKISEQLDRISGQLVELQTSVNNLQASVNQLQQLVTQGTFDILSQNANQITNAVDTTTANFSGILEVIESGGKPEDVTAAWTAFMTNLGTDLVNVPGKGRQSSLLGKYLDPTVSRGLLYWANQITTYANTGGQQSLYNWQTSYVPLRTMLYYGTYQALSAQLEALWYRSPAKYGGGGQPNTAACASGSRSPACIAIAAATADFNGYPNQIVPVLPPNTLLDLNNKKMWVTRVDPRADAYPGLCPANRQRCLGMYLKRGTLQVQPQNAYQTARPELTWQVDSTPLPGIYSSRYGSPVDGGANAFSVATTSDIGTLVPQNPTLAPAGNSSSRVPVTVKQWLLGAAGFDDSTVGDRILFGDGKAPYYPVPIVSTSQYDTVQRTQSHFCTWGSTRGYDNFSSYLILFSPYGNPALVEPYCQTDLNTSSMWRDGAPSWDTAGRAGIGVGPSDISQQPWSLTRDDTFLRDNLISESDARSCKTSGTVQRSGSYWRSPGGLSTDGVGHWIFWGANTGSFYYETPVLWSAAGGSTLTFKTQVLNTTSQQPNVSWSPALACGVDAGTTLLVRSVEPSFYTTPGGKKN